MPTSFEDILLAFEFVGSSYPGANRAILCRPTGKIYYQSDDLGLDEFNDELPAEDADGEGYIAILDKRDLDLGKPLALDFAAEFLPTTSMMSGICSAGAVPTRNSRPC